MHVNYGMITVPYYEWWLHHHPFKREEHSCPLCSSDTGCFKGCPANEIDAKLREIGKLAQAWMKRSAT